MPRLLLLAVLALLTACTSLNPPAGPAPVETRDIPRSLPDGAPAETPRTVGPPLPPDFDSRAAEPAAPARATPASTLLAQVDEAIAAGALERAAALAERTLRIAPRDPQVWYKLASIQFQQRRYADAEGSAQRALSFAGGNQALTRTINALLATIRSAR
jgi:tetratricopeptide (TPR) repeat protein